MELLFIINPTAGKGMTVKAIPLIKEYCSKHSLPFRIIETSYAGEATVLAREAVKNNLKGVIAVGGDGTVLETANGLMGSGIPLGILPLGSGNDFARALNIPRGIQSVEKALQILKDGKTSSVDVGLFFDCAFLNVASIGFDAEIVRDLPKVKRFLKGSAAYVASVFYKFLTYKNKTVTLTIDGQDITTDLFLAAICNGTCYGGGMKVNPNGSPTDGFFDLILIKPVSRYKVPLLLGRFKKGLHLDLPYVSTYRCKEVKVTSNEPLVINADGEAVGETPATFAIRPLSIKVFTVI